MSTMRTAEHAREATPGGACETPASEIRGATLTGLLGCLLFAAACDRSPPPVASAPPVSTRSLGGAERFLPLLDATVFAYDTHSQATGQRGLLVLEVRRRRADMAELVVAGRTRRVELAEEGIRHATGGWLLKQPLTLGATFQGDFGGVRISAIDRSVKVAAGSFDGCLETIEAVSNTGFSKSTTTLYCPNVGIVTRLTEAESDEGADTESMRLRSFGPKVDLGQ